MSELESTTKLAVQDLSNKPLTLSPLIEQGVEKPKEEKKPKSFQGKEDQEIADNIWKQFDKFRNNRNLKFNYFRGKDIYEYINTGNAAFNNYKIKPSWKDEWQSNLSDITTHAKVMAIIAQVATSNLAPEFYSRFGVDVYSEIKAGFIQDLYHFTDTSIRNGQIDLLFTALRAAREGTVIGFEGWKKTRIYEGNDVQFVALEDFYPGDMKKFRIQDQLKCVWRTVISKDDFDEGYSTWYQFSKVRTRGAIGNEERSFFNISSDITEDQVEILRYFDLLNDEYSITANGILITKAPSKLSTRFKGNKLPFWKAVYEPYDDNFFYGRSLPDLLSDNQEGIDFLFNSIFDKEILSVLKPILVGGVNQLMSDYWTPGKQIQVSNVDQIKEMPVDPPDLTAFRVLQELQNRSYTVSVDQVSSGVALGRKTATEIERSQEAAKKIYTLFSMSLKDAEQQKGELRGKIIQQYMIKSPKYKNLILRNVKLRDGKFGTKLLDIKNNQEELTPKNQYGFSPKLAMKNTTIMENSEIWEFTIDEMENFEFYTEVRAASSIEMSAALKKAFVDRFTSKAYAMPQIYNPMVVAQIDVENNKDILGHYAKDVINKQVQGEGGEGIPGSELTNELTPTSKTAIPKLKSMLNEPI